jgi:hypothetical protein
MWIEIWALKWDVLSSRITVACERDHGVSDAIWRELEAATAVETARQVEMRHEREEAERAFIEELERIRQAIEEEEARKRAITLATEKRQQEKMRLLAAEREAARLQERLRTSGLCPAGFRLV